MHAQFQMSGTKTWWVHGLKWMVKILIIPLEINESLSNPSWPSFPRCNAGKFHASAFTCSNSARARSACKQVAPQSDQNWCAELQKNRHCRVSRKNQGHHLESSNMELVIEIPYRNYPSSVQYSLKWELHPAKTILS